MTIRTRPSLLVAAVLAAATQNCAWADDSLVQTTRALQYIQAAVAVGDARAAASQTTLMKKLGALVAAIDPDALQDRRKRDAISIYLLSGGDPAYASHLFVDASNKAQAPLVFGAFAFSMGHPKEAVTHLEMQDLNVAPPGLAAQIAYVLSVLYTEDDPDKALAFLEFARLAAPGALVEEVALRRETLLSVQRGEADRFARLMRQYFLRYSRSPYAAEFSRTLAASVVKASQGDNDRIVAAAIVGAQRMSSDAKTDFLLTIARELIYDGAHRAALLAARASDSLAAPNSQSAARAGLYSLISALALGASATVDALDSYDAARLPTQDRELLQASKALFRPVRAPLDDLKQTNHESTEVGPARSLLTPTLEAGAAAIARADNLLKRRQP